MEPTSETKRDGRPCAVIGPECAPKPQRPRHDISPRRTFQENMSRVVLPSPAAQPDSYPLTPYIQQYPTYPYYPTYPSRSTYSPYRGDVRYCEGPALVSQQQPPPPPTYIRQTYEDRRRYHPAAYAPTPTDPYYPKPTYYPPETQPVHSTRLTYPSYPRCDYSHQCEQYRQTPQYYHQIQYARTTAHQTYPMRTVRQQSANQPIRSIRPICDQKIRSETAYPIPYTVPPYIDPQLRNQTPPSTYQYLSCEYERRSQWETNNRKRQCAMYDYQPNPIEQPINTQRYIPEYIIPPERPTAPCLYYPENVRQNIPKEYIQQPQEVIHQQLQQQQPPPPPKINIQKDETPAMDLRRFVEMWDDYEEFDDTEIIEQQCILNQPTINITDIQTRTVVNQQSVLRHTADLIIKKSPTITPSIIDISKPLNHKNNFFGDELIDVEAKISQSVIHKEVGCNFEIKPCSPPKVLDPNVKIDMPKHKPKDCLERLVKNDVMIYSDVILQQERKISKRSRYESYNASKSESNNKNNKLIHNSNQSADLNVKFPNMTVSSSETVNYGVNHNQISFDVIDKSGLQTPEFYNTNEAASINYIEPQPNNEAVAINYNIEPHPKSETSTIHYIEPQSNNETVAINYNIEPQLNNEATTINYNIDQQSNQDLNFINKENDEIFNFDLQNPTENKEIVKLPDMEEIIKGDEVSEDKFVSEEVLDMTKDNIDQVIMKEDYEKNVTDNKSIQVEIVDSGSKDEYMECLKSVGIECEFPIITDDPVEDAIPIIFEEKTIEDKIDHTEIAVEIERSLDISFDNSEEVAEKIILNDEFINEESNVNNDMIIESEEVENIIEDDEKNLCNNVDLISKSELMESCSNLSSPKAYKNSEDDLEVPNFEHDVLERVYDEKLNIKMISDDENDVYKTYSTAKKRYSSYLTDDSSSNDNNNFKNYKSVMLSDGKNLEMSTGEESMSPYFKDKIISNNLDVNGLEVGGCWIDDIACVETVVSEENEVQNSPVLWNSYNRNYDKSPFLSQESDDDVFKDSNGNLIDTQFKYKYATDGMESVENDNQLLSPWESDDCDDKYTNLLFKSPDAFEEDDSYKYISNTEKEYNEKNEWDQEDVNNRERKYSEIDSPKDYTKKYRNEKSKVKIKTKGAQKYIPPIEITNQNLKCHLPLPKDKLLQLKLIKSKDSKEKSADSCSSNDEYRISKNRMVLPKKPVKPLFEDVLKKIDETNRTMIKMKLKKAKRAIPKMIIKKDNKGSHYASVPKNEETKNDEGEKWQPQVCLRRSACIEDMVKSTLD